MVEGKIGRLERSLINDGMGLFEETAILKRSLMWGEPGVEVLLGQLLPEKISLFFDRFDVLGAREEFRRMVDVFVDRGVEIILVKDLFASVIGELGDDGMSLSVLNSLIKKRGVEFYKKYGVGDLSVLDLVDGLLTADVEKYGERVAVEINRRLVNLSGLPMANVLYARDQSNLVGESWLWSSMKHEIRQPEVELYKYILADSGFLNTDDLGQIIVEEAGVLEGGDIIVNDGICYVGVGGRTNFEGVNQIACSVLDQGLRLIVVVDHERDKGIISEMDTMHLDTMFMPISKTEVAACEEELSRRVSFEVVSDGDGNLSRLSEMRFIDHLQSRGVELIPVTKEEQKAFAPNFQNLGGRTVVVPLEGNGKFNNRLRDRGIEVVKQPIYNITRGFGATHCSMAPILRI